MNYSELSPNFSLCTWLTQHWANSFYLIMLPMLLCSGSGRAPTGLSVLNVRL